MKKFVHALSVLLVLLDFITFNFTDIIRFFINILAINDFNSMINIIDFIIKIIILFIIFTINIIFILIDKSRESSSLSKTLYKCGIENVFVGRHGMQSNGYAIDMLLENVESNSEIYIFSRSARAFSEEYKMLQKVKREKNLKFFFILPNPELDTFDNRGKSDLLNTLSIFEAGISDKTNFKVYFINFYPTYSFVLIEKQNHVSAVIDQFIDLPYEKRHTITLKSNDSPCYFINSLIETKNRYLSIAKEIDLSITHFNEDTKAYVFNE